MFNPKRSGEKRKTQESRRGESTKDGAALFFHKINSRKKREKMENEDGTGKMLTKGFVREAKEITVKIMLTSSPP